MIMYYVQINEKKIHIFFLEEYSFCEINLFCLSNAVTQVMPECFHSFLESNHELVHFK